MDNLLTIRDGNWNALDMSRARLDSLRFFETTIADCSFDHAKCHDWRLWGSTVQRTSFRHANLRRSVLGGVDTRYRTNSFVDVDFSKADFRQTVHRSATYTRCKFTETNLTKVDFDGSVFVDCVFAGELREVVFNRSGFELGMLPPNEMSGVDFSKAKLRSVEFRGLDMKNVKWPDDDGHIIVNDYAASLRRIVAALGSLPDPESKGLAAYLGVYLKWAGRNQKSGVFNKLELLELVGDAGLDTFLRLLRG